MIRAAALEGFRSLVTSLGADPEPLLTAHGLSKQFDAETLVSLEATAQLLEDAATSLARPDLGLRLGGIQGTSMLGALAVVINNAPDLGRALTDATRYLFVHSPAYELILDETSPVDDQSAALRFGIRLDDDAPRRQLIDGCMAFTLQFARILAGPQLPLRAVSLPHTPLAPARTYRAHFDAPVHFEQPYAGFHFDKDLLSRDHRHASGALRGAALAELRRAHQLRATTTADLVRHALTGTMGAARGTRTEVAEFLGIHPRTLQRRLDALGTTFEEIRETEYRRAALQYLRETEIPLAQVAAAMGYSEHAAFTRACRRWFGEPPSAVRNSRRADVPRPA